MSLLVVLWVSIGRIFAGESMFARHPNASKVACWGFERLFSWGVVLFDSQVYTEHLERFGAREIPRDDYMRLLSQYSVQSLSEDAWTVTEETEQDLHPKSTRFEQREDMRADREERVQTMLNRSAELHKVGC